MNKKHIKQTACILLYVNPDKEKCNLYTQGELFDLQALLVAEARIDEKFELAILKAADFIAKEHFYQD